MLLDAIATIILAGMMLIPVVNVFVGAVAGAALGGVPGVIAGVLTAIAITLAERQIADRYGWREVGQLPSEPEARVEDDAIIVTTVGRGARSSRTDTPRTRPPHPRMRAHRARERAGAAMALRDKRSGARA